MLYHFGIYTEVSFRGAVELLLMGRETEPHVDPQHDGDLQTFVLVHGVLKIQTL